MRVVVIGGLGNFGARICKRLKAETGIEIIATGRHSRQREVVHLDIDSATFAADLKALAPDLVIHCAGPFQGQDYRVALASLAGGAHYIDIADGRDFVAGFVEAVGPAAEAAGRAAITGASTLPALSSAVVDSLSASLAAIHAIDTVIAPGQQAPRGVATMSAVLGYAGKPFECWQDGAWSLVHGWQSLKRVNFSFGPRLAAVCDVPDLALLPRRYPEVQTVTFRAALEVPILHLALWAIAACRRVGIPIPMVKWAGFLDRFATWLNRFGSGTGGMSVQIAGCNLAGREITQTWELIARDNHGPEIPCMAALLLAIRSTREGLPAGAKVCMGMLTRHELVPCDQVAAHSFLDGSVGYRSRDCILFHASAENRGCGYYRKRQP
jgi:NAD dependent epimerase/dehydratase family